MSVELAGEWQYEYNGETYRHGHIELPGTLNGSGAGEEITRDTVWLSGLHNPFWYEREEYSDGTEGELHVPFLSQPKTRFVGKVRYSRTVSIPSSGRYYLFIELAKWRITVYLDDEPIGTDESLCVPFVFGPISIDAGEHWLCIEADNSLQHPYRPDAHSISDALGGSWNGLGGRLELMTVAEYDRMIAARRTYARRHRIQIGTKDSCFMIDGRAVYLRGTHFGGDFPLTGMPSVDKVFWRNLMTTVREWGFNFIRCHSFCPPEAAFLEADRQGVYLQVECGMWNMFNPDDAGMYETLMRETRKILETFGHHPSFIMLSPSNEPGGDWYMMLKRWVFEARVINRELGYEGRRLFTAQSGWYYDVPPSRITADDTDYIYFHRSAFGPIHGGMIRNRWGWQGRDYSPSLEGCRLPVISHEMGQWCSYPDFDVISRFTGYARPGNYEIFRARARKQGVLRYNKDFVYCSGRNQLRLLKEDFEANLRTPEITGFEYLDLHDYTGQGTAIVGLLDPFWHNKGYVQPEEFRCFNDDIVLLTRLKTYVFRSTDILETPVEVCNFSGRAYKGARLLWKLTRVGGMTDEDAQCADDLAGRTKTRRKKQTRTVSISGEPEKVDVPCGCTSGVSELRLAMDTFARSGRVMLEIELKGSDGRRLAYNSWELTVFKEPDEDTDWGTHCCYTRDINEAEAMLNEGRDVIFNPYLSDMDYECPTLSMRNVFWNAQMGPEWSRGLGLVIDEEHPLFADFPTDRSGGWQWEDILSRARGLCMPAGLDAVVRVIDDWNRDYPLVLMFEGLVGRGRLFCVTASLDGSFEERPSAAVLRNAIESYVSSDEFRPTQRIDMSELKRHIRPLFKGSDIIASVTAEGCENVDTANMIDINPNRPFVMHPEHLPVTFDIRLRRRVRVRGLYCLPIQNDRDFPGVIRELGLSVGSEESSRIAASGQPQGQGEHTEYVAELRREWRNCFETQYAACPETETDRLRLTVYSTYGMGEAVRWREEHFGFFKYKEQEQLTVSMAALGVEYDEIAGTGADSHVSVDLPALFHLD